MPHIVDVGTLDALVHILIVCMPHFEKTYNESNVIMNQFIDKDKELFYKDKILHLTNQSSLYRLDSCMACVSVLTTNNKSKDFFNENDIDLLVDIALRELSCSHTPDTRI